MFVHSGSLLFPQRLGRLRKNLLATSGAKAHQKKRGFIAALKALRHPKSSFSANRTAATLSLVLSFYSLSFFFVPTLFLSSLFRRGLEPHLSKTRSSAHKM
jgi:hypothetical protein